MKPLAERLSKKQKCAALVALIAGSILYIIFYPPDIPRPNTITFEGYAPAELGIISAVVLAKAERNFYFCKRHYLGVTPRDKYQEENGFATPNIDGHYKIVLNINNISLGGLCRYRIYAAHLTHNANPPNREKPSYSSGSLAAVIKIPPRSGPTWTRRVKAPYIELNNRLSTPLRPCCEYLHRSVPDCKTSRRTIKSFDKNYTFRVDLELNPEGCPPFVDEEGFEL